MSIRQIRLGSRSCFIRFSVPLCLLMLLMCGSADSQVKAKSALEQLETQLIDIQIEVDRLRRAEMVDAAKGLAACPDTGFDLDFVVGMVYSGLS